MSDSAKQALFWAPRVLLIALTAFLSLFAMDVFDQHLDFRQTAQALTTHLMLSFVLIVALILGWRWEGWVRYSMQEPGCCMWFWWSLCRDPFRGCGGSPGRFPSPARPSSSPGYFWPIG